MTDNQREKLLLASDDILNRLPTELDSIRNSIDMANKGLKIWKELFPEKVNDDDIVFFENCKTLGKCRLLIGLLALDLTTSFRMHLKAKYEYERIYSTRQMIVIIKEGFQNLYHYNEKGRAKKSYWISYFDKIIKEDLTELEDEYNNLTNQLEAYLEQYLSDNYIKGIRDLSVHYDKNSEEVYDMIKGLETKKIASFFSPFLKLIVELFGFTNKMMEYYSIKNKRFKEQTQKQLDEHYQDFENFRERFKNNGTEEINLKVQSIISEVQKMITDNRHIY